MKIPKIINKNGNQYIFEKKYPNFIMYKDMLTGVKECFSRHELGLVKSTNIMKGFKLNPQKVSR